MTKPKTKLQRSHPTEQRLFADVPQLAGTDLVRIEKSLHSLGFFCPAQKKQSGSRTVIQAVRYVDGKRVQTRAVISSPDELGLPTTADRDKYMAFMKIVMDRREQVGAISNPVRFSGYELLRTLRLCDSGNNYDELNDWLERMTATTIRSEYTVYLADRKQYAKDIFHVFDRVVLFGQTRSDGSQAELCEVYLSQWQLDNINAGYLLPLDINAYLELRKDIAKALFGHLHVWFYASKGRVVEKRYSPLCELLNIRRWPHLSKARQILAPSLDELASVQYLSGWDLAHTTDGQDFKLIFYPGERLLAVTQLRLGSAGTRNEISDPATEEWIQALMARGVREDKARQMALDVPDDQYVMDQIEWGDHLLAQAPRGKFYNPPGLYLYLIREKITPPPTFETSRKRKSLGQQALESDQRETQRLTLQLAYDQYREKLLTRYIDEVMGLEEMERRVEAQMKALHLTYSSSSRMTRQQRHALATQIVRRDLLADLQTLTLDEFAQQNMQLRFSVV